MRHLIIAAAGLALAGCSNQPKASDAQLNAFDPPTVQLRGDVMPRQERRFERLDKNKDDFLEAGEFRRDGMSQVAALDDNNDGKVSRSELTENAIARFDRLDANKDQQVTPQERAADNRGS